jgi:hypothetical protein
MVIRKFIDEDIAEDGICEPIDNYKCVAYWFFMEKICLEVGY